MPDRKPQRPRIDTIIKAIEEGTYDDKLGEIQQAVSTRLEEKRQALLAQVQELYGPDAQITTARSPRGIVSEHVHATARIEGDEAIEGVERTTAAPDPLPLDSPPVAEPTVLTPNADGPGPVETVRMPQQPSGVNPADEDENGYVSHSPIIGGIPMGL